MRASRLPACALSAIFHAAVLKNQGPFGPGSYYIYIYISCITWHECATDSPSKHRINVPMELRDGSRYLDCVNLTSTTFV
ncbi:hypothetical protein F5148DRAFT_168153 [Russula earlei]|uniref:Uncharacterized protein n=1 Tax=Russula earlei TaxID=71964 RepID=A0ACC0U738_9AGAM|nr:hypothetical protein F5148DRAFT_168153 [Russula earlei]